MEKAPWRLAHAFGTAVAGDGHVDSYQISLASGEGGPALLWLAALYKAAEAQARLTQRAAGAEMAHTVVEANKEIKPAYIPVLRRASTAYYIEVAGEENLVNLVALIPAVGINPKAEEAVMIFRERGAEKPALEVRFENPRKTNAADVVIRAGSFEAKYNPYFGEETMLRFGSADPETVEKAAHLLRLAGVKAEVGKAYDKIKGEIRVVR